MAHVLAGNVSDIRFTCGSIDNTNTTVVRFHGREALSEISRFVIDMATTKDDITLDGMVGQDALLTVLEEDGDQRYFHGIISRFDMIGHTGDRIDFRAEIVPRLWLLTQRHRSCVYQNETTGSILKQIFTFHKMSMEKIPDGMTRAYCVQYNESDYAFCSRLMEEDGLFFHHVHEESDHIINVEESAAGLEDIGDGSRIEFKDLSGGADAEEFIYRITLSQEIRSGKVHLREFDFNKPTKPVEDKLEHKLNKELEVYTYPGEYDSAATAKRWVKTRLEEYNAKRQRARGESSVRRFAPGFFFELDGHPWSEANQKYLLTAIEHRGSQKDAIPGASGPPEINYENMFECQPASVEFKAPRITPRPRIAGTQTAIVTGPANEEVHTDKFGRVKVHFHWDREGPLDGTSSCWVRVSQGWAGAGWGAIFIPRIGQEVLIDFENGDPDKPMVTGRVYNGENSVPYPLPDEKTKSTIKSNSSIGGGGFNEIRFEDAAGSEEIYVHAQKDYNIVVENDRDEQIGNDRSLLVKHDKSEKVENNKSIEVSVDHAEKIGANKAMEVGANHSERVGANMTIDVGSNLTETVGINYSENVGASMELTVGGAMAVSVGGGLTESVGGSKSSTSGSNTTSTVGGNLTVKVSKNADEKVSKSKSVEVTEDLNQKIGGKNKLDVGKEFNMTADKVQFVAKKEFKFKVGSAELVLKKNGDINIKGKKINIKGSGDVILKGSKVAQN